MAKKSSTSSRPAKLKSVTSEDIRNRQWTKAEIRNIQRLAAQQAAGDDSDIDFEDIPRLTDEQLARMVRLRELRPKVPVSVRLDPRVLEWLRSKGEGHLTRINDILTNLMEAERGRPPSR
jgi:uncharacterized protein (DUF4415 family)